MSETQIVIIGTGGFGREVQEVVEEINAVEPTFVIRGFFDSNPELHGQTVNSLTVLGDITDARNYPEIGYAVAVGTPKNRAHIVETLRSLGATLFPKIIHPAAHISPRASLGEGCIVRSGASIQTGATLGDFCSLSQYCVIGHDSVLEDYVSVAPHVCIVGGGHIGEGVNIGTGVSVVYPATVGDWCTVGAGSTVVHDLPPNVTAVGSPARVIKEREPGWHR